MFRTQLPTRALAALSLTALAAGCSGGGSGPGQAPTTTPTAVATGTTTIGAPTGTGSAYTCSASDTVTFAAIGSASDETRREINRRSSSTSTSTGLLVVSYAGPLATSLKTFAGARESAAGVRLVRETTYANTGRYDRLLRVTPGTEMQALALLRAQPGVVAASVTGLPRNLETVTQKYYTNDTFYNGFSTAQLTAAGEPGTAPTYHVDPYEESSTVPGQWDMHAVRLDFAQAYSQANNGSGIVNASALGSSGVRIAIIDSGEDSTHPELASKIAYQKCFISSSSVQSTSNYSVDQVGHGTDVAGIAAAASNNNLGFTGAGGNASIFAYRVFPKPDDTCVAGFQGTVSSQCYASTLDIASAINDAVAQKVNVISLSLGGGGCTNGVDQDVSEQNAVANALKANIVVVAASGNDNPHTAGVSSPGCITGVIAAGASALNDGMATGTSTAPTGTPGVPVEYAAGYSQYGSPALAAGSSAAWGILAPGGDPSSVDVDPNNRSTDLLHWIENIWTSTPLDTKFAGNCNPDLGTVAGSTPDCRTLIAGTSQATPIVAGAAALIIAANPAYQSPSKMKQLLCSTAHDISDAHEGCGRLDIYRAMATAVGDPNLPASK